MRSGSQVAAFERAFAEYVGAKYAIALCNGTATLHVALSTMEVKGKPVFVPPLTMAATTIAVLHAGGIPVFRDVDPKTWLMQEREDDGLFAAPVSLYGLNGKRERLYLVDDAAQTLRRPDPTACWTSYSFQASKILALGEGGMLATDDEGLAIRARQFSSLGYRMRADQPRIDPEVLKSPTFERHHTLGWNYRMNDITAAHGLKELKWADILKTGRQNAAALYRDAIAGCEWLTPQHVPDGWTHDYWTFAVATDTPERLLALLVAVERHDGERPYPAWRLTYREPAFAQLNTFTCPKHGPCSNGISDSQGAWLCDVDNCRTPLTPPTVCPVAEALQPRLAQFQTNNLASAERNAKALRLAIEELS